MWYNQKSAEKGGTGMEELRQKAAAYVSQMTPEEKAAVSHRGKALAVFEEKLKEYLAGQR